MNSARDTSTPSRHRTPASGRMEPRQKRQKLTDEEVLNFIRSVEQRAVTGSQDSFVRDDVLSMTYLMGNFIEAVERVMRCPSADKVLMFKSASTDTELLDALEDPYVSLALKLKNAYDKGNLPLFDTLLDFKERNPVELQPDNILEKFYKQASYFLPPLAEIRDEELKLRLERNDVSDDLVQLGRGRFEEIVSELLALRFPDQGRINALTKYLFSRSVTRTWARLFQLPINDKTEPSELFNAHFGATSLANVLNSDKASLKTFASILIEPIVMQLDDTKPLEMAKGDLGKRDVQITYKTVHTTMIDGSEVHMVHAYAGEGNASVLIGFGTASTEEEAQAKSATNATNRESQLTRLINSVKELEEYHQIKKPTIDPEYEPHDQAFNTAPDPHPYQHSISKPQPMMPPQPQQPQQPQQLIYAQPAYGHTPPQPMHHSPIPAYTVPTTGTGTSTAMTHPPNSLINEEYQRQKQYDDENVILVPNIEDDAAIDKSSKEKLNHMLIENRYAPAEYKTSKISNSDVQVTCIIENIPMSRAIATNKKRAGQLCAQFILNYSNYFFRKLPPRT